MGMTTTLGSLFLMLIAPCLTADQSLADMFAYQLETCNYLSLCPSPASSNSTTQQDHGEEMSCCKACSCSATCLGEGTCCPNFLSRNQSSQATDDHIAEHTECLRSLLLPVEQMWTKQFSWYFMVSSCPRSFSDLDISSRCRQRNLSNVEEVTPVYSSRTGRIYANQYCSICHREEDRELLYWDTKLACRSHSDVENKFKLNMAFINQEGLTPKEVLQLVITRLQSGSINSVCNIAYEPPSDLALSHLQCVSPESIESGLCPTAVLKRLNFDPFLRECVFYSAAYDDEFLGIVTESVHKLVYCFLCQGWSNADVKECDLLFSHGVGTPFSISLNYRDNTDTPRSKENECNDSEVYDPFKDMCRMAICPYFSGPPSCNFLATELYNIAVKFHLRLVPGSDVPPLTLAQTDGAILEALENVLLVLLQNGTDSFLSKVLSIESWYKTAMQGNVSIVDFIFITVVALPAHPCHMNEMYGWLDNVIRHTSPLVLAGVEHNLEIDNRVYEEKRFRIFITDILYNGEKLTKGGSLDVSSSVPSGPLLINRFYFCRQVELGADEFQLTGNEIIVSLSKDITVKLNDYYNISKFANGSVRVCIDDLLSMQLSTSTSFAHDPRPKVHTFALVLCSIVSLCLLIGYEIRFETYINNGERLNIALKCFTIIVEMSFALAHQPFKLSNITFCRVVGVLNHFVGLQFSFLLSACAYYTWRQALLIYQGSTRPLKYIPLQVTFLSTGSLSGVFVSVSVFVSLMQSDATQIGYGTESCFLSSLVLTVSTFILPAGVFILFSIICLTVALVCLFKSGKWRQHREGTPVYQRAAMLLMMAIVALIIVIVGTASLLSGVQWMSIALEVLIGGYGVWCLVLRTLVPLPTFCTGSVGNSGN